MTFQMKKEKVAKGPKELPPNPTMKHPVQLLNEMKGPVDYELMTAGVPPKCQFTAACVIDNRQFQGMGKSKKEAKKAAAMSALQGLYNLVYPVS